MIVLEGQVSIFDLLEPEKPTAPAPAVGRMGGPRIPALFQPLEGSDLYCIWCGFAYAGGYNSFDFSCNHGPMGLDEGAGLRLCTTMDLTKNHVTYAMANLANVIRNATADTSNAIPTACCWGKNDLHGRHVRKPTVEQWAEHMRRDFHTALQKWGRHRGALRKWYSDELTEHGLAKYSQPPFKVNINVWQGEQRCGWCNTKSTIGGFATRHPEHEEFGCYGDYCRQCSDMYGSPRLGDIELIVNLDVTGNHRGDREQQILETIRRWKEIS